MQGKPKNLYNRSKIKVYPPAKINIYLNIVGKYGDGFHKIESIVNRINLFDELTIERIGTDDIIFSCSDKSLEGNNLCTKAACLLKEKFNLPGFNIRLNKNIPVGAGLGGGSSDAAYTLLGINKLMGLGLSKEELFKFGLRLGSDVNFFAAQSSWAYISRRGGDVEPLNIDTKFSYLLVYPHIRVSTKLVYEAAKPYLTKFVDNVNILKYALGRKDYLLVEELSFNCLEKSALSVYSELKSIRELFRREKFFYQLSGSGSVFFTFLRFSPYKKANNINIFMDRCRKRGFSVFAVQTY